MNLLKETIEILNENGKSIDDVLFVTDGEITSSFNDFSKLANRDYDNGYGGVHVNESVKIVGVDWWLERHEYDGSEWWEFKTVPKLTDEKIGIISLWDSYYFDQNKMLD